MLRIIHQSNSAAAKSYYSKADYYAEGQELTGVWGGKGADRLGLKGEVEWKDFSSLCDNLNPTNGKPLTPRTQSERRVLYDFNFHVPKSVSLAFELTGDQRILAAFRMSVDETMREAEEEMKTRVRAKGEYSDRVTEEMVYATFIHRTSRPSKADKMPDPHLHAHVTVFNATFDPKEKIWKAGQFGDLKKDAPYWQAGFHARFAKRLSAMGYGITRTSKGWELSGVAPSLVSKFSRRTQEIEKLAADLKITDPWRKDKLGATSRERKVDISMENLHVYWDGRLSGDERKALKSLRGNESTHTYSPQQAITHAADHCLDKESVVNERQFYTEALKVGVGRATMENLRAEGKRQGVLETEWEGQKVVSTRAVLEQERDLLEFARRGRGTRPPLAPDHVIYRDFLHEDQKKAVLHLLNSSDRVMMIRGAAGTGKTTLTKEAVEGLQKARFPVAMLAPSAFASRDVLRGEKGPVFDKADTVAKFLSSKAMQEQVRGGVVWVDEAGLLGIKDMHGLFTTANRLDARIVLMGDSKQHGSVSRGPALKLLETHAGLKSVQVLDIKRQKDEYKGVAALLAKGQNAVAFEKLDAMGWIHELPDAERAKAVAADYLKVKETGSAVIVDPTKKGGAEITDAVRSQLKAENRLGEEREFTQLVSAELTEAQRRDAISYQEGDVLQFHKATKGIQAGTRITFESEAPLPIDQAAKFQVYRPGQMKLAVGDAIKMTGNGTSVDGHRFSNGASYTIKGFSKGGDVILDNGWTVAKDFGHWTHGYVSTSIAIQGKTIDHVIVSQTEASGLAANQAQAYVSLTRGKYSATIYTDSKASLKASMLKTDRKLSATEVFAATRRAHKPLSRRVAFMQRLASLVKHRQQGNGIELDRKHERDNSLSL